MDSKLIERLKQWNDRKYGNIDYPDRTVIILKTLKPEINGYTWKQETDDMIEEYNTWGVTTAPKYKE